ncbi:hypothetical protein SAMN04488005_1499 [Yoonia tamlensis]|uniref:Uncharacterized protein n=1 Tax=Yoonia tamlensis TaxID=390270 RepID=A0A1I6GE28_9RHOB|nr:hypothetical protein [Yoonia tamlensis]SFR40436.1 hypothetical protein SAMN04488005_1499 [Yoonia tamlensis]
MPSGLTLNTLFGVGVSSASMAMFGDVFPDTVMQSAVYGGLGGMARWVGSSRVKWTSNLSWVPLGVLLAVGLDTLGGPLIATYLNSEGDDSFLREVLSGDKATRGIAFAIGLFGTMIIGRFVDEKDANNGSA